MTRTSAPHTAVRLLAATLALAFAASGLAQGFPGTYQAPVPQGVVTVQLTTQGERLFGQLEGPGVRFDLEGWVEDGVGVGVASSAQGALGFEAVVEGDTLGLWFYEVVNGAVVPDSEIEVILTRVAGAPAAAVPAPGQAAPPVGASPPSPGAQALPPSPSAPQPGGKLIQTPPAQGGPSAPGGGVAGAPTAPGGGALGAGAPAPQSSSPVLATGAYAQLTRDDALAFIEALEFVLAQMGYAYTFTDADRAEALRALAQNYPTLDQTDQVVLSQARAIWERVRANWHAATAAEQQEFAVGVLVLAFGEQNVAQWAGSGRGGGGGGQCTTFEDCTSAYVGGSSWSDTFDAQSCWAAAGCESYDPVGGFTYDDPGSY